MSKKKKSFVGKKRGGSHIKERGALFALHLPFILHFPFPQVILLLVFFHILLFAHSHCQKPITGRNTIAMPSTLEQQAWPALPLLDDARTVHVDQKRWIQYPCPPELRRIPISVPPAVASMVRESTRKEKYSKRDGSNVYGFFMDGSSSE